MASTTPFSRARTTRRLPLWGRIAILAGIAGLVASPSILPPAVQALLVGFLIFLGPGAAVRNWLEMTPSTTAVVVPAIGLTTVILLTTVMAAANLWNPTALLAGLSLVVIALGCVSWSRPGRRERVPAKSGVVR